MHSIRYSVHVFFSFLPPVVVGWWIFVDHLAGRIIVLIGVASLDEFLGNTIREYPC